MTALLLSLTALAAPPPPAQAAEPAPVSHCAEGETLAFGCPIGVKQLALCWSGTPRDSGLQYRFGKLGAVELAYPTEPGVLAEVFDYQHNLMVAPPGGMVRPRLEDTSLGFAVGEVRYQVFEEEVDFQRTQGVRVFLPEGRKVELTCAAPSKTSLQALSD